MPSGFLQGFYEDEILGESQAEDVGDHGHRQALHLAMLGLVDEAHAIFTLLQAYDLLPAETAARLFYHASGLAAPSRSDTTADVAALELTTMEFPASYLPEEYDLEKVTEDGYEKLRGLSKGLAENEFADAETGRAAIDLSAVLATSLYVADKLGKEKDVLELFEAMSRRILANGQAEFFHSALVAWEKWFVPGMLRDAMGLELSKLKGYAEFVRATVKKRLENGPVRPEEVYAGFSVRDLLEELDRNTKDDSEFDPNDYYFEEDDVPATIFKEPASEETIEAKENEMGRKMPEELKELLRVSDGCHMVKTEPGMRDTKFVPVEDIFVEDDEYMDDYGFTMLPDFQVEPKRPSGMSEMDWEFSLRVELCKYGGAIAVYDPDGQGTNYVWILPKATVDAAREKVAEVYDKVGDKQKERIDGEIVRRYGSKEVYEGMDYAVNVQGWGCPEGVEVYPDFGSFIRAVVYNSRASAETSPLKMSSK